MCCVICDSLFTPLSKISDASMKAGTPAWQRPHWRHSHPAGAVDSESRLARGMCLALGTANTMYPTGLRPEGGEGNRLHILQIPSAAPEVFQQGLEGEQGKQPLNLTGHG